MFHQTGKKPPDNGVRENGEQLTDNNELAYNHN